MSVFIEINEAVEIAGNWGVHINENAVAMDPLELHAAIKLGFEHACDEHLQDACCGGHNLLNERKGTGRGGRFTLAEYLDVCKEIDYQNALAEATRAAKRHHVKRRRAQYSAARSELALAMINAGVPYVCASPDCDIMQDLTIDHIVPVSRGSTDEFEQPPVHVPQPQFAEVRLRRSGCARSAFKMGKMKEIFLPRAELWDFWRICI